MSVLRNTKLSVVADVLGSIGALLGAVVAGELDIRAAIDAARGRRGI